MLTACACCGMQQRMHTARWICRGSHVRRLRSWAACARSATTGGAHWRATQQSFVGDAPASLRALQFGSTSQWRPSGERRRCEEAERTLSQRRDLIKATPQQAPGILTTHTHSHHRRQERTRCRRHWSGSRSHAASGSPAAGSTTARSRAIGRQAAIRVLASGPIASSFTARSSPRIRPTISHLTLAGLILQRSMCERR